MTTPTPYEWRDGALWDGDKCLLAVEIESDSGNHYGDPPRMVAVMLADDELKRQIAALPLLVAFYRDAHRLDDDDNTFESHSMSMTYLCQEYEDSLAEIREGDDNE